MEHLSFNVTESIAVKFNTNKERGNTGISIAIGYFGSNGYVVSVPLNDTQDYDLIVDDGSTLKKVQVKSTGQFRNGAHIVALFSVGGTNGKRYKTLKNTDVDLLFVLCSDGTMYLIPVSEINQVSSLNLRKKPSKFSQDGKSGYSEFIVTI